MFRKVQIKKDIKSEQDNIKMVANMIFENPFQAKSPPNFLAPLYELQGLGDGEDVD